MNDFERMLIDGRPPVSSDHVCDITEDMIEGRACRVCGGILLSKLVSALILRDEALFMSDVPQHEPLGIFNTPNPSGEPRRDIKAGEIIDMLAKIRASDKQWLVSASMQDGVYTIDDARRLDGGGSEDCDEPIVVEAS